MSLSTAFLVGSIGPGEVLLLFLVILLLFGPRKLPEIARWMGKTVSELRRVSQNFRDQVMQVDREMDKAAQLDPSENPGADQPGMPPEDREKRDQKETQDHERAG